MTAASGMRTAFAVELRDLRRGYARLMEIGGTELANKQVIDGGRDSGGGRYRWDTGQFWVGGDKCPPVGESG